MTRKLTKPLPRAVRRRTSIGPDETDSTGKRTFVHDGFEVIVVEVR